MWLFGYKQSQEHSYAGGVTVLLVYVENIIVTENDNKEQEFLSCCLVLEFDIKTLGG